MRKSNQRTIRKTRPTFWIVVYRYTQDSNRNNVRSYSSVLLGYIDLVCKSFYADPDDNFQIWKITIILLSVEPWYLEIFTRCVEFHFGSFNFQNSYWQNMLEHIQYTDGRDKSFQYFAKKRLVLIQAWLESNGFLLQQYPCNGNRKVSNRLCIHSIWNIISYRM